MKHFYFTETSGLHYRSTYAIDSTTAEVLVFGSSRANHHYVPQIFEDNLKMSFYNTGRDGNSLLYTLAVFKAIIKRYTPKIIIIDLMSSELSYNVQSYDRLSSLQPYYFKHPEIQKIVRLRGPFEKYKLLSSIYPFNSSFLTIIMGNMKLNIKRKKDYKGYVPLFNQINVPILVENEINSTDFDTTNIDAIKYISTVCKSKNIRLVFIQSPLYAKVTSTNSTTLIQKLATENNAFFLNYFNDSNFLKRPAFFQGKSHLNDEGAKMFSSTVTDWILKNSTK